MRVLSTGRAIEIDGILISHCHPDHTLDLIAIGYALMTEWISQKTMRRVPLALPRGGLHYLETLSGLFGHRHWRFTEDELGPGFAQLRETARADRDWMFEVFDIREFAPGDTVEIAGSTVRTLPVDHVPGAVAMRFDEGGKSLVYTGDTSWIDDLAGFAHECDLLISDSHFSGSHPPGGKHMSPSEAGRLAALSGARALMLTHLAAAEDAATALAAARAACDVPVCLALTTDEITL